tara:strand:- start:143 stop:535 length:393 start_codon:yes stop_codon:yes gene_type:complete
MNIVKLIKKQFFISFILVFFLQSSILQSIELDLTVAQNAVGTRFASKFCEAKKEGFSSETSSEFALNNTYLKFASFPEDKNFVEDLWAFTIIRIRKDCGNYLTEDDEINLRDFFQEEAKIASSRDFYLPH